ncbi:SDR family NAD(P)-dependent oxidoreductase [Natronorubrum daqingense]|uniref:Peroxisomal trans-2-enoyl-CoA reductase n=1 Tax=Natronorubrum daqingense TaxID=588898 RepID=A0A1N7CKZ0_9EURY|nr:glucose 1-dehydrogenase [Natronorubrum daqingense]APX96950.1 3-oxoacyl-ACP reductase [Natronorubrum daqingense]SIR64240.1 NAD(P)-dependent dehydrogenase, short-chain alcohol dehydrogenase family [Natronorubrum daqingense]
MHEPDYDVTGKTAIVTGASQGIGEAIAKTLAASGANVSICSRSMDRVGPVADEINDADDAGEALALECNVREREQVQNLVDETVETFGDIDVLVNNAGGEFVAPFEDISANGWQTIVDLNLNSTVHCTQLAGEVMREGSGGAIINLSSVNGQHAAPGESHYGASKAAIIRLTETLATEWADDGIRVNCIAPGLIQTPGVAETLGIDSEDMPPREKTDRRIGHVEEIADVAQFLSSPAASFMNGETVTVKGVPRAGNSMSKDLGLE